ncbi:uncharacterized protein [Amphiura filiformis]|uniref:uncharacterized protein n=1 Tax=Amphiura filiformis TaxID=82378 RepID=UPI003B21EC44
MSTFIGILLDVSGSMRSSIGEGVTEEGGTWAHSVFTVIDDLIKHDVSNSNRVFAVGVGASKGQYIFDTLGTIQEIQRYQREGSLDRGPAEYPTIEDIFRILESNGAWTIRKWTAKDTVRQVVSENEAQSILNKLRLDRSFTRDFVDDYLPKACREVEDPRGSLRTVGDVVGALFDSLTKKRFASAASSFVWASTTDIEEVVRKAMATGELNDISLKGVSETSVFSIQDAANIIHGCVDERVLRTQRATELLKIVEPFIYGGTPLHSALGEASALILGSLDTYPNHRRLLFILSDGCPTDSGKLDRIQSQLRYANVTVVSCYIYRSSRVEPRRLYSVADRSWERGARFLFNLSSKIPTDLVTRAIFIKHGWQIDINTNETKLLFM